MEPPVAAQAAFNRVNEARALKQQMIEQAERARVELSKRRSGIEMRSSQRRED